MFNNVLLNTIHGVTPRAFSAQFDKDFATFIKPRNPASASPGCQIKPELLQIFQVDQQSSLGALDSEIIPPYTPIFYRGALQRHGNLVQP